MAASAAATVTAAGPAGREGTEASAPRVLLLDPIAPQALADLRTDCEVVERYQPGAGELPGLVRDADVIVVRSGVRLTAEVFRHARRLKVVARAGSGTDNIDLEAARAARVQVFNVPGASARAVAELAVGLLLTVCRKIALADRQIRAGVWDKPGLLGTEVHGRTLGVVGLGRIGSRIAELGTALGMRVVATVARPDAQRAERLRATGVELADLDDLLARADAVCLAVPLDGTSRGLIGAPQLARMRDTAVLVNVSRGGVVDEEALARALRERRLAGAALDVHAAEKTDSPLAEFDTVVLTPHIGAMTEQAQERVGRTLVSSIRTALAGGSVATRVC